MHQSPGWYPAWLQVAAARQHLISSQISERDANRFGCIDSVWNRDEKARRPDRILCIPADNAEIGDQLTFI